MIITKILAQEIFNAQGFPTIQCTIHLASGVVVKSSIPTGFQAPSTASAYSYDIDNRIIHERMLKSINFIHEQIAPRFLNQPINALVMDSVLMDLQVNHDDKNLGSNTTLVVSMALFKAQAAAEKIELFQLLQSISGTSKITKVQPLTSIFECIRTENFKDFKEILALSADDTKSYEEQLHSLILLHHHTQKILELKNIPVVHGSYGSFVISDTKMHELFSILEETEKTLPTHRYEYGINLEANEIYDQKTNTYILNNKAFVHTTLIQEYQKLILEHPNISLLYDPIADKDVAGWQEITSKLTDTNLVADHIFGSNPLKIRWGIMKKIGDIVAIKSEYVNTISQTLAAIDACKNNKKEFMITSDRFGTDDSFSTDLAVATGAKYLKAGAPFGAEHITKYNRLLEIERILAEA
jgi:enolase